MRAVVTGGRGFIGGHIVDALVDRGDEVAVIDNGSSGENENAGAQYLDWDLAGRKPVELHDVDVIFHTAAIGRTPHAIAEPVKCWETNLMASVKLLELARQFEVPRIVLSSSNIVYAAETPYRASKLAMEEAASVYTSLYGLSTICLRYANTYGPRQREDGIGPNVFASLRKSLRENGYITITGDGHQSRDFIHVSDVVQANLLAADCHVHGNYDICTGKNWSMNEIAELLGCEVRYTEDREGDIKHITQNFEPAWDDLGFISSVNLANGIWDSFPDLVVA